MIELAPSILSADFARLGEQVRAAAQGGASIIHVDIMDGHFVPNLTIGPPVVKSLRKVTDLPLDCHLMIENPDEFIPVFAELGVNWMSVNPGFGAQQFIPSTLHKMRRLAEIRSQRGLNYRIEVDGGVALDTVADVVRSGAEILVAGNAVFGSGDPKKNAEALLRAATEAALEKV